jgi:hypothetical protein
MPEFKLACGERLAGGTHDHSCHYTKGHEGLHGCYCGVQWDERGKISVRRTPRRR